jgi:O-antigen ligase
MVRTALVAVVGGALALALLLVGARGVSLRLKLVSVGLVMAVLAAGYASAQVAGNVNWLAKDRAESLAHPFSDYSVTTRVKKWKRTLERVEDEPLGSGPGTIGRATIKRGHAATDTDNSYLKVLREQGFPGGFLFVFGVLGATLLCGLRLMRAAGGPLQRRLGVAALAGFVAFLLLCVMGEYIEQPGKGLAWTLLGIASWEAYGRVDVR